MGAADDSKDIIHDQQAGSSQQQGQSSTDRQGYSDYTEYEPEEIDI